YFFTPTAMLYANVGKGFRSGGPTGLQINTPACQNALRLAGIGNATTFNSDHLINYELGYKTEFADGRARFDAAVFYIDWTDLQVNLNLNNYDPGCPSTATVNAGKASSKGGEIEFEIRATDSVLLSAAGTYTKARLGAQPAGSSIGTEGDPLQNAPEWQ